ncbi:MAG TPA: hypothetical protein VMD56_11110 [Steroidobacteraceae bacterium]|nr:hypothetical protein [Steroidobacteraceae bacterium]
MNPRLLTPLLITALVLWAIYRRVRRSFGRQPVIPARLYLSAGVLGALGALLLSSLWRDATLLVALLGGVACGAVLSQVALRHTRFEATPQGRFYTPHTYIGLLVIALFIGRLLFRFLSVYGTTRAPLAAGGDPLALYRHNPLTLAIIGLLIGYYVLYNLGVLSRTRSIAEAPPGETSS